MADDDERGGYRNIQFMSPMQQYGSSIILLTNPEDDLYKLELSLRSMKENKDGELEPIPDSEPDMNEKGIKSVMGQTQAFMARNTVFTNLENEVPNMVEMFADTMIQDLMLNRRRYNVAGHPNATRSRILTGCTASAYFTMRRAYKEGDKRFWKGSVQEIHSRLEQSSKKTGLLNMLNPWKKQS